MAVPRNILVIRLSSLGDVLLTMPAVQAIKSAFPAADLSWLVEGSVGELLLHQAFVDRVIEFPRGRIEAALKKGSLLSAGRDLSAFVRNLRAEEYDVVLDFHGIVKSALLTRTARAGRRIGFDRTYAKEASWLAYDERVGGLELRMHKARRNMLLAAHLGARDAPDNDITASPEAAAYIDRFLAAHRMAPPFVAVNPFCSRGSEFKRWDLADYGGLIRRLGDETGATVMILWGPGEEVEAQLLAEMAQGSAVLACPTTVSQAFALLKRAALYIGGDTGMMHLAALARVPVVAIFGPTDHLVNGPYGNGHTIVRAGVSCSPCRDKECKKRECLRSITVDVVFRAVMATLSRIRNN
jgi:3-deoxy-D-manno-octulosonic-acid transferase/heptosyltransferase-1